MKHRSANRHQSSSFHVICNRVWNTFHEIYISSRNKKPTKAYWDHSRALRTNVKHNVKRKLTNHTHTASFAPVHKASERWETVLSEAKRAKHKTGPIAVEHRYAFWHRNNSFYEICNWNQLPKSFKKLITVGIRERCGPESNIVLY